MDVTIIGTANMGRGISRRLAIGGHRLTLLDINISSAERLAAELREICPAADVQTALLEAKIEDEIVILALKYAVAREVAERHRTALAEAEALVTDQGTSAAEEIAGLLPEAEGRKGIQHHLRWDPAEGRGGWSAVGHTHRRRRRRSQTAVLALVQSGGMRGVDVGQLKRARQLEALGLLSYVVQGPLGLGFMSSWKLIR
jgi:predicted dinucleotide-binding enzyme